MFQCKIVELIPDDVIANVIFMCFHRSVIKNTKENDKTRL